MILHQRDIVETEFFFARSIKVPHFAIVVSNNELIYRPRVDGYCGFWRQSFAYPDFARDIIAHGAMLRKKCCITCTKCTEIMRFGGQTGCVVKDSKVYLPIRREVTNGRSMMSTKTGCHV